MTTFPTLRLHSNGTLAKTSWPSLESYGIIVFLLQLFPDKADMTLTSHRCSVRPCLKNTHVKHLTVTGDF